MGPGVKTTSHPESLKWESDKDKETWRQGASGTAIGWLLDAAAAPKTGSWGGPGEHPQGLRGRPQGTRLRSPIWKARSQMFPPMEERLGDRLGSQNRGARVGGVDFLASGRGSLPPKSGESSTKTASRHDEFMTSQDCILHKNYLPSHIWPQYETQKYPQTGPKICGKPFIGMR